MSKSNTVHIVPQLVVCPGGCGQRHQPHLIETKDDDPLGEIRCEKCKRDFVFTLPTAELVKERELAL